MGRKTCGLVIAAALSGRLQLAGVGLGRTSTCEAEAKVGGGNHREVAVETLTERPASQRGWESSHFGASHSALLPHPPLFACTPPTHPRPIFIPSAPLLCDRRYTCAEISHYFYPPSPPSFESPLPPPSEPLVNFAARPPSTFPLTSLRTRYSFETDINYTCEANDPRANSTVHCTVLFFFLQTKATGPLRT